LNFTDFVQQIISPQQSTPSHYSREQDIRNQIEELDRQAVAFNEAIGLLRAGLSLSNQYEREERSHTQDIATLQETQTLSSDCDSALSLAKHLSEEALERELINTYVLRKLYHQILEAKRRFLRHWYERLHLQIKKLPEEKQYSLRILLENCFQGALTVGVEQVEARCQKELQQVKKSTQLAVASPPSKPTEMLLFDELFSSLKDKITDKNQS